MVTAALEQIADESGLSPEIIADLRGVFADWPQVDEVVIHGSRARGDHRPGSDIDLAVFAPKMTAEQFARLWAEIDALPIAYNIDLLHFDQLGNATLKAQIVKNARTLYKKPATL